MDGPTEPHVIVKSSPLPWALLVLLLAAGGAGLYLLVQQQQAMESQLATERSRADEAQHSLDEQAASAAQLRTELTRLNDENTILNEDRHNLEDDVAAKNDELDKLRDTYQALKDDMKAEIAQGDIELNESGGKLRVELVDEILFRPGEAQISPRGAGVLQRVGRVLARVDDKQIQVAGHTDLTPISPNLIGIFPTNWELSTARATNVVRFLSEKVGVPGKRLVASGYGPFHPIASNATSRGRARNRRIEIVLTPLMESVPKRDAARSKTPDVPRKHKKR